MPIEDIDYLKENSIKQSYVFMTDSADRDHAVYPNPNNYILQFTQPFQNVVGLEVIDASIPRTMYNVDFTNNTIAFLIHSSNYSLSNYNSASNSIVATITPGDYTIQTLVPAINEAMAMYVNNDSNLPFARITASTTTNPPEVQSTLQFTCPYPFLLDMNRSTIAESLGFDLFADSGQLTAATPRYLPMYQFYSIYPQQTPTDAYRLFHSIDKPPEAALGPITTVYDGPRGILRNISLAGSNSYVSQRFVPTIPGYVSAVNLALTTPTANGVSIESIAYWRISSNMDGSDPLVYGEVPVSFIDGAFSDTTSQIPIVYLEAQRPYYLVITSLNSDDYPVSIYYNDVVATQSAMYVNGAPIDTNGVYFGVGAQVIFAEPYHTVVAPGIYNLTGQRYVLLRCPEIEDHSFSSLSFSYYHVGLARFKLGVVGYSENTLEFVKMPTREFHPIGKLSRMTLTFELPDGTLYDFKGVNHTVTFVVHYLEPKQMRRFDNSVLIPGYTGDYMDFMFRTQQESKEEDSDDEETEDFSRDRSVGFNARQRELMYMPDEIRRRDLQALYGIQPLLEEEDEEEGL